MCDTVTGVLSGGLIDPTTPDYAGKASEAEAQRQQRIGQGTQRVNKVFGQFGPEFYNQRAQAYTNYAMPQLGQQYRQTRNAMNFGLANRGLRGGSVQQRQQSDLTRQMQQGAQSIADTGRTQAQALQQQIEAARQTTLNQLYSSADPANARAAAVASAAGFQVPQTFAPLSNMFSNLAQQYYTNQLLASIPTTGTQTMYNPYQTINPGALPPTTY